MNAAGAPGCQGVQGPGWPAGRVEAPASRRRPSESITSSETADGRRRLRKQPTGPELCRVTVDGDITTALGHHEAVPAKDRKRPRGLAGRYRRHPAKQIIRPDQPE